MTGQLRDFNAIVDASRLDAADKERVKRLMALVSKSSREMNAFELRAAREAAGLTVRQAASLVNLSPQQLCDLEDGEWIGVDDGVTSTLGDKIDEAYGLNR